AAHVNYHHRIESDEEEKYVRSFCAEHHLDLYVRNEPFFWDGNFEAAARNWRYEFFEKTVREHHLAGMLIGHQEDDVIETYIMQKERNIIPDYYGLRETGTWHGIIVHRPLLSMTKQSLQEYCETHGIRYFFDSTNALNDCSRNRIRHETVNPMNRMERDIVLREIEKDNAVLQERRCRVKTEIQKKEVSLDRYRQLSGTDRLTLLRMIVEEEKKEMPGISLAQLTEIDRILMTHRDFMIPVRERFLVQKDRMMFMHAPAQLYAVTLNSLAEVKNLPVQPYFRIEDGTPGVNAVTVSEADFPLTIRNVYKGDAIQLRFGTKPVHRFFIDRHIPLYQREFWPVVVSASGEVILVPGIGCDVRHFSMTPDFIVLQLTHV
ncbi:MAG: tRNA lysidine(34) synthetase TilS, partial [Erysipelotrichia bacterium]|nr:tRNA lysidine(34) synthetase TilS [Erysipelotrichia bacterium]